jgi:hypothetical protein
MQESRRQNPINYEIIYRADGSVVFLDYNKLNYHYHLHILPFKSIYKKKKEVPYSVRNPHVCPLSLCEYNPKRDKTIGKKKWFAKKLEDYFDGG